MSEFRPSMPPYGAEVVQVWVLDSPAQLHSLRANLFQAVTGHSPADDERLVDAAEKMLLVATELATNALKHGLAPTRVQLSTIANRFVLDVADHDPTTSPTFTAISPESTAGRGLHLARALSVAVGWYASQRSKHVWATFDTAI